MGLKVILYDYTKTPPEAVTFDSTELQNVINTLPNHQRLEFAIQEPNFQPITVGHYFKLGPNPQPTNLLYDSNTDIDWAKLLIQAGTDQFVRVDEIYGDQSKVNSGYIRTNASGNPRILFFPRTKEICLEHDGSYGRLYFGKCNYQSRLECEFKLDSCSSGASFKLRNRHQFRQYLREVLGYTEEEANNVDSIHVQGGQGCGIHCGDTDADFEIVHGGGEASGPTASLSPKLEANKYYGLKFAQFDKSGKIHVKIEIDRKDGQGFKTVNEGDVSVPIQCFNRAEFEEWSEFWARLNNPNGGRLFFKNLKLYKL
jgi:hypothetical protein